MSAESSTPPSGAPRSTNVLDEKAPIAPMGGPAAFGWTFVVTFLFLTLWMFVGSAREGAKNDLIASFACQVIAYSLGLFLILRVYAPQRSIRDFLGLRPTSWALFPIALLLGVLVTAPADLVYNLICSRYPTAPNLDGLDKGFQAASIGRRIFMGVVLSGAGPFLEEVFFRGALFRPLARRIGPMASALMIAVLFALIHIEWQTFAPIVILGLCLGLLRAWSGSLYVPFLVHAGFNSVSFVELLRESTGKESLTLPLSVTIGASVASALLLAAAYFISSKSVRAIAAREADA